MSSMRPNGTDVMQRSVVLRHPHSMEAEGKRGVKHLLGRTPYTFDETPSTCTDTRHWIPFQRTTTALPALRLPGSRPGSQISCRSRERRGTGTAHTSSAD